MVKFLETYPYMKKIISQFIGQRNQSLCPFQDTIISKCLKLIAGYSFYIYERLCVGVLSTSSKSVTSDHVRSIPQVVQAAE